ncbi:MAG: hypothetical protein LQ352_008048 [Teloschistes flavicans]|nr:MAG: hypothetical protein LQ352_008048 [Teloschistes flavicans]
MSPSIFKPDPNDNLTLSAFSFPLGSGSLTHRGIATGDPQIVWCCQNTSTYITIDMAAIVRSEPGFDITQALRLSIKDVEARITQVGNSRLGGGQWALAVSEVNKISALDTGGEQFPDTRKHLTWPVLRDSLKALSDLIADRKIARYVHGLEFKIHSAFYGEVGKGDIG